MHFRQWLVCFWCICLVFKSSQSPSRTADLFVSFCVFWRSWPPSVAMAVGYATVRRCEMDLSRTPGSWPSGWVCEWEKESPGLHCTLAHMGLPAAAVNVMITLPLRSQLLMGKGHVVFHAFSTHVITHKWQQMMKHTTCKLGIKHFPDTSYFLVKRPDIKKQTKTKKSAHVLCLTSSTLVGLLPSQQSKKYFIILAAARGHIRALSWMVKSQWRR